MFTDVEIGLMHAHRRNMNSVVSDAQRIVDSKNDAIEEAHGEIRRLHQLLANETARRQAAELERDDLKLRNARLAALARSLA